MCGIVGIYSFVESVRPQLVKKMADVLRKRGPDDEGFIAVNLELGNAYTLIGRESKVHGINIEDFDGPVDLILGHRRLSIIDLSPLGHQPLSNEDGCLWVVHNGEIYNYLEIRKELASLGHQFKSQTDTEVIVHAYEEWGTECLKRFNGMWAFAVWDLKKKTLFCSRDRAGVKPFYYIYDSKQFCFASEIKALLQIDTFSIEPNEQIVADYLFSGIIDHTRETFFKNIYQLRPGEYVLIEDKKLTIRSYWDIEPREISFSRDGDYAERFYELLEDSIRLRLRTDVPIGTCLSGGLDSSSIACLANKLMFDGQNIDPRLVGEKQKTFSSCFDDPTYDERKFIELVTHQTGAEKNYVFPKAENLFQDLSMVIWQQEEPFGSTSIYAQWNVMRLIKESGVKVLLDGQGGDEILAGYLPSFYFLLLQSFKQGKVGNLVKQIYGLWRNRLITMDRLITRTGAILFPIKQQEKEWTEPGFQKKYFRHFSAPIKYKDDLDNYLYTIYRYLKLPALLHYEDRNSMAFSLEARLPYLDYRLVEFAFGLPAEQKINQGVTKVVLRKAMEGILPEAIRNRKDKMAFGTPDGNWFRTILRKPIFQIINSKRFAERGYFNSQKVRKRFEEHVEGKVDLSLLIWRYVNMELWLRTFIDKNPSSQYWRTNGN